MSITDKWSWIILDLPSWRVQIRPQLCYRGRQDPYGFHSPGESELSQIKISDPSAKSISIPEPTVHIYTSSWIWKGVTATLQSGRYTLSYPRWRHRYSVEIWWQYRGDQFILLIDSISSLIQLPVRTLCGNLSWLWLQHAISLITNAENETAYYFVKFYRVYGNWILTN